MVRTRGGSRRSLRSASLLIVATGVLVGAGALTRPATDARRLRLGVDSSRRATLVLDDVHEGDTTRRGASATLALYVDLPDGRGEQIDGRYEFAHGALVFRPHFALVPGVPYVAIARPNAQRAADSLVERLTLPRPTVLPSTTVTGVFPSADTVPENLLRFYVELSRPMRAGDAARHVRLLDDAGREIPRVFLGLETEIWDASRRRLTVLLDPGRIKRGLRPNRELGPPLMAGRRYRLHIDSAWRDENGAPLLGAFEKAFVVAAPQRARLEAAAWTWTSPAAGTRAPIELRSSNPIDHALITRAIRVEQVGGGAQRVRVSTRNGERSILLTPSRPWTPGEYRVLLAGELEDVAGNNFQRPFDLDLTTDVARDDLSVVALPVTIRPL